MNSKSKIKTSTAKLKAIFSGKVKRTTKKEISKLKKLYKKGKLKFDSKKIAEGILEDFRIE